MNSLTSLKVNRAAFTKGVYATWFEPCNPRESPYNGALVSSTYFSRNPTLDAQVRASYGALLDLVLKPTHKTTTTSDATQLPTELRHEPVEPFPFEPATPNEALSLIIFFDQFPRNLYRDTSFFCAGDPYAVKYAALVDKNDWDRKELFAPLERLFLALPYEHSECLEHQHRGMAKLRKVVEDAPEQDKAFMVKCMEFGQAHVDLIKRFGRFPYRNALLQRPSTDEEKEYMREGGVSFLPSN